MNRSLPLADVLQQLMRRPNYQYTAGLVSKLAGVPRATIENWLDGQVRRPRRWQDLVKVADALRLSASEATQLLQTAGHPPIEALLAQVEQAQDRALLAAWIGPRAADRSTPESVARLPVYPDSFVGRVDERAALGALLRNTNVRLVTLTGPGGSGKTRLALQVAAELASDFAHRVWFVPLAHTRDAALVTTAIGQALGVAEGGQSLADGIRAALRDRQVVLLLDNFEHVAAAASVVAELLRHAPQLKVLITSRLALRLHGEHVFPVPPFKLPQLGFATSRHADFRPDQVAELADLPAIALFVQRAQAANPDFTLHTGNAWAVAALCVRLDGLPLAIELAAARSGLLEPSGLLEWLADSHGDTFLRLLSRGARDLLPRQQTLAATLTWSYMLLDQSTQHLFRRLAIFAGGADLDAIAALYADGPADRYRRVALLDRAHSEQEHGLAQLDSQILDDLAALLDHSLLMAQQAAYGVRRFMMLETIREYALERLARDGELAIMQQRHAMYFLAMAETAAPELQGPNQADWLARLELDHANMCVALTWFIDVDPVSGLRLANALYLFWWIRCYLAQGRVWLERLLAQVREPIPLRASALRGAGQLAHRQGDYAAAQAYHSESLALYRRFDDRVGVAMALDNLGHIALHRNDYVSAHSLFEESLALTQQLGDQRLLAVAYRTLGLAAAQHCDYEQAAPLYYQSLSLARLENDQHGIAMTLGNLGDILRCRGANRQAAEQYTESLALFRTIGDQHGIAWALHNLGQIALSDGDTYAAAARFRESLILSSDLGAKAGVAYALAGLAGVAAARGDALPAARLLGAVEALLEAIQGRMSAADRATYAHTVAVVHAALERDIVEHAWRQGRSHSIEQAIREALG
jgi:predicted ATPase